MYKIIVFLETNFRKVEIGNYINWIRCRRKLITALYGAIQSFVSFLGQRISLSKFPKFRLRWSTWVCVEANFSKTAKRNKTPFTGIQVLLKLSSNKKTDQQSVHSTRRYSNIKVQYQMTKMTHFGSCFWTITNNHSLKPPLKYTWGQFPLSDGSNELNVTLL